MKKWKSLMIFYPYFLDNCRYLLIVLICMILLRKLGKIVVRGNNLCTNKVDIKNSSKNNKAMKTTIV